MKELKLTITHQKILDTIRLLNVKQFFPNQEGVYKILSGIKDEETEQFLDLTTFGTLISYSSKKICRFILPLFRYGYIEKKFDRNTNDLYLAITFKGKEASELFHKKYKKPYPKANKILKKTIVKI